MRMLNTLPARRWLALAIPALIPAGAFADPLILAAGQPDEQPVAAIPARPQNPLLSLQPVGNRILVLSFQPVNPGETNIWVGKSVQESLVADLSTVVPDRIATLNHFADSVEAAIALGRQSGARYVIAGGFVTADHEVRITGQVLDVQSGQPVTGLKVTGDPGQIFRLEDTLAMQVKSRLFPGESQTASTTVPQVAVPQPRPAQQEVRVPQPVTETTVVRNEYISEPIQQPAQTYYSTYATAPAPVAYGADYATYTTYPSYTYTPYVYSYPAYSYSYGPYCDYGYGYGGYSNYGWGLGLGLAFSFGFGGHYHDYGHHDYGRGGYEHGHNYNYYGRVYTNNGFVSGGVRASTGGIGISGGVRSPAIYRGSASNFSRGSVSTSHSFGVPYRAPAFYDHGSFGRSSGISGGLRSGPSYRSFGSGGASRSSGASVSHSSGGGGHASSGHSGGGHR